VRGVDVDQFQTTVVNVTQWGTGTNVYNMFVNSKTREPVQLHMKGINFIHGSHPDIYIFDYHKFQPRQNFSTTEFAVPDLCQTVARLRRRATRLQRRSHHRARGALAKLARLQPPITATGLCAHKVHPQFHDFALTHGKHYMSAVPSTRRARIRSSITSRSSTPGTPMRRTRTRVAVNQYR
jgi:hypothetical protein